MNRNNFYKYLLQSRKQWEKLLLTSMKRQVVKLFENKKNLLELNKMEKQCITFVILNSMKKLLLRLSEKNGMEEQFYRLMDSLPMQERSVFEEEFIDAFEKQDPIVLFDKLICILKDRLPKKFIKIMHSNDLFRYEQVAIKYFTSMFYRKYWHSLQQYLDLSDQEVNNRLNDISIKVVKRHVLPVLVIALTFNNALNLEEKNNFFLIMSNDQSSLFNSCLNISKKTFEQAKFCVSNAEEPSHKDINKTLCKNENQLHILHHLYENYSDEEDSLYDRFSQKIVQKRVEIQLLNQTNDKLVKEIDIVDKDIDFLKSAEKQLDKDLRDLRKEYKKNKISFNKVEFSSSLFQLNHLKKSIKKKIQRFIEMTKEKEQYTSELLEKEQDLHLMEQKIQDSQHKRLKLQQKIDLAKKKNEKLRNSIFKN